MALGKSKQDWKNNQLSLFIESNPGISPFEDTIFIDPDKEELGKISQYDLISQSAEEMERQGII